MKKPEKRITRSVDTVKCVFVPNHFIGPASEWCDEFPDSGETDQEIVDYAKLSLRAVDVEIEYVAKDKFDWWMDSKEREWENNFNYIQRYEAELLAHAAKLAKRRAKAAATRALKAATKAALVAQPKMMVSLNTASNPYSTASAPTGFFKTLP